MTSSAFDSGGAWHWQLTACCNSPAADDSFTIGRRRWMGCTSNRSTLTRHCGLYAHFKAHMDVRVMMTTSHKIVTVMFNTQETRRFLTSDFLPVTLTVKFIRMPYDKLLLNKDDSCCLLRSLFNCLDFNKKACVSPDLG